MLKNKLTVLAFLSLTPRCRRHVSLRSRAADRER